MIFSMTAFGQAGATIDGRRYTVEIKSVNNKYNDIAVKLPPSLRSFETALRKQLAAALRRGKIFVAVTEETVDSSALPSINGEALMYYKEQLQDIFPQLNEKDIVPALLRRPEVWEQPAEDTESLWEKLQPVIHEATEKFVAYRRTEGEEIRKDMLEKVAVIRRALDEVEKRDPGRLDRIRQRLGQIAASLRDKADPNRLEQELLLYMDRLDINEEKQRLRHHLDYFLGTLEAPDMEKGKKLHFIAQEMGREINTLGAKANDADIQRLVVEMKDALEKIKEQTANVV
ncbi:MAG: YicC family protein [Chlorobi bacterium]|nr:YicC family protein [Chlorobiota bacterium]